MGIGYDRIECLRYSSSSGDDALLENEFRRCHSAVLPCTYTHGLEARAQLSGGQTRASTRAVPQLDVKSVRPGHLSSPATWGTEASTSAWPTTATPGIDMA